MKESMYLRIVSGFTKWKLALFADLPKVQFWKKRTEHTSETIILTVPTPLECPKGFMPQVVQES